MRNHLVLIALVYAAFFPGPCAADELPAPAPRVTDLRRVAIAPAWSHAFLPRSVSTDGIGLGIDYFPGRSVARGRLGFSLAGALHGPFSGEPRRRNASAFPLSETLGFVTVELRAIVLSLSSFELDVFGGTGAIGTRPVSVIARRITPAAAGSVARTDASAPLSPARARRVVRCAPA